MNKLKYLGYSIVFQEVPDEVTLAINISGCPHKCVGCHSKYLWEYTGNYISDELDTLINKYEGLITCVCFMGGDQNPFELSELLLNIRNKNIKTALYTGNDMVDECLLDKLDYYKVGGYVATLGGLNSKSTNQKMFKRDNNKWCNITHKFWKED